MEEIEKKVRMCALLDAYGKLLTQKQQQIMELYFGADLSLFEISENLGITRQAVHDSLLKAETALEKFEAECQMLAKFAEIKQDLLDVKNTLPEKNQTELAKKLDKIISKI
jgi:hypothetical protein